MKKGKVYKRMPSILFQPIPVNTLRKAKTVFNIENVYLTIGNQLSDLLGELNLDDLDAFGEKPANSLFLLAMVTLFQFVEELPDRRAADAVRTRLDWKYALHLPLDYPGIDYKALREFRYRLRSNRTGQVVFEGMLTNLEKIGLWKNEERHHINVTTVLNKVDTISQIEETFATMNIALEILASKQPDWLRQISLPHWYERYDQLSSNQNLPASDEEIDNLAQAVKADVTYLINEVDKGEVPELILLPEIQALRQICHQFQAYECEG